VTLVVGLPAGEGFQEGDDVVDFFHGIGAVDLRHQRLAILAASCHHAHAEQAEAQQADRGGFRYRGSGLIGNGDLKSRKRAA
jgi:hypothetical protein